ncbi:DUF2341 domain-containing protein [Maribacter sp. 2304DJ31-5]|uniref:DUF2341 domain-containing protein n=1 Tax=Maribacter sp. 2304DJ31-5 TaxID=3386273 RepID=UPI0039BC99AA
MHRLSPKSFLKPFFFFLLFNFSLQAQVDITIEVNWPNWSSDNRVTFRNPSNIQIGATICDPVNCFNAASNTSYDNIGSRELYSSVLEGTGYSIELEDAFGDGWNGAGSYVRVYQDGVLIVDTDLTGGNSSTVTFDIVTLVDTDGDGVPDDTDLDDDNDGIPDTLEYCSTIELPNLPSINAGGARTITYTHTDTGYLEFDFNTLDNSFQLSVNGTNIHNRIIQFENGAHDPATEVLMRTVSGNVLINTPWVANTNGLPRIKVIIDENGNVFLYGTRNTTSISLEPLGTNDSSTFNSLPWIPGNTNTFVITNPDEGGPEGLSGDLYLNDICDSDGDGVSNRFDLDSDNDGIYDIVEGGALTVAGVIDANNDGIIDGVGTDFGTNGLHNNLDDVETLTPVLQYSIMDSDSDMDYDPYELDSDNDSCNDVIEAGYTDDNGDGLLGPSPQTFDTNGMVTSGSDGYTTPDDNNGNTVYDFQEVVTPTVTVQPSNVGVCGGGGTSFAVTTTDTDAYQWQVSVNGGLNFSDLSNGGIYSGVDTATLTLSSTSISEDDNQYRVMITNNAYVCGSSTMSNAAILDVQENLAVNAGADDSLCSNSVYILDGRVLNASTITWSGSTGISNTGIANPTYTPTAAEITAGTVTLTLTAEGIGACSTGPMADTVTLTIESGPTVNAGTDDTFCADGTYNLDATVTNASAILWSGSSGISDTSLEDPIYTPTAAEIAAGTVTLTMGAYGTGGCNPLGVPNYAYRKKITVDSDRVIGSSDFTDYALLVNTIDPDLRTTANGGKIENVNGYDIVFTTSDGTTLLSHQLEKYDEVTGELATWISIPTLSTTTDTVIYMYYGNAGATDTSTNGIWPANYQTILHLGEDPTATAPQMVDATGNTNSGIANGMTSGNTVAGIIGDALTFDEIDDYIRVPDFDYTGSNAFTISFWFKIADNTGSSYQYMFGHGGFSTNNSMNAYLGESGVAPGTGENTLRTVFQDSNDATNLNGLDAGTSYIDGQWHQYTFTTTSSGNPRVYIDGIERSEITFNGGNSYNPTTDIFIGSRSDISAARFFGGELDEIRILDNAQSADLIITEYNNQSVPNDFYHIGAEIDLTPITDTVTLTIEPAPTIDVHPTGQTAFAGTNTVFSVTTSDADTYQWQVSIDGGASFNNIMDGMDYTGTQTQSLTVIRPDIDKNDYRYRVQVSSSGTSCISVTSNQAILNMRVARVLTNRRITYRVKKI